MQQALKNCSRIGGSAITLEDQGKNYDAYRKYIDCCLQAFSELSNEVEGLSQENHIQRLELARLAGMCTERIVNFCQFQVEQSASIPSPAQSSQHTVSHTLSQQVHHSASPHASSPHASSPQLPRMKPSPQASSPQPPFHPSSRPASLNLNHSTVLGVEDPMEQAKRLNQMLVEQLKKRLEKMKCNPQRKANLTQELFRKIVENNERAKEMLEKQKLRQQQLKAYADRRTSALNLKDNAKKKEHNELLASILIHDEKFKWPLSLKSQLKQGGDLNSDVANEFCSAVLRSSTHPLAQVVKKCQTKVRQVTDPLLEKYSQFVFDTVSVPYQYSEPVLSDEAVEQLEASEETEDDNAEDINSAFERNCNLSVEEIKVAKYMGDKEISKLLNDDTPTDADVSINGATSQDLDDDMDYLFDSDEDEMNNINQKASTNDDASQESSTKVDNVLPPDQKIAEIREKLDKIENDTDTFKDQLSIITECIHETMHCLSILFRLAYDDLNCDEGYDVINTVVQEFLFAKIGEGLLLIHRLTNMKRERKMADIMTDFLNKDIGHMQVNQKWYLDTRGECYNHLINNLHQITTIHSPLNKALSCAVKLHMGVVETTAAYYSAKQMQEPMGADDLLPIICYIIVKSQLPQIISQCSIMTEFIPPEYMMEQEGYCLSTVQMAVEYLLTLN